MNWNIIGENRVPGRWMTATVQYNIMTVPCLMVIIEGAKKVAILVLTKRQIIPSIHARSPVQTPCLRRLTAERFLLRIGASGFSRLMDPRYF